MEKSTEDSSLIEFGKNIKEARKDRNLTQKQFAKLVDISQANIARYEKGSRKPTKENLDTLSSTLRIPNLLIPTEEPNTEQYGKYLKKFRVDKKFNQNDIAAKLGLTRSAVTKYENGTRNLSKDSFIKYMDVLKNDENTKFLSIVFDKDTNTYPKIERDLVGERINDIRVCRKESLSVFGKSFTKPVGKNVIHRWTKGINIPDIESLMNIAYLGNTTVPSILYGESYENFLNLSHSHFDNFKKLNSRNLGLRLMKIRKDHEMDRKEFGKKFVPPINKSTMDRYENGRDIPNTERLVQYSFLGKVSLQFLIYGHGVHTDL